MSGQVADQAHADDGSAVSQLDLTDAHGRHPDHRQADQSGFCGVHAFGYTDAKGAGRGVAGVGRVAEDEITDSYVGHTVTGGNDFSYGPIAGGEGIIDLLQPAQLGQFGAGADQGELIPEQDVVVTQVKLRPGRLQCHTVHI